jgi:ferredoxin
MVRRTLRLLHGFVYGRWPRRYIHVMRRHVIPRLSVEGKQKLADGWHAKVLTHENAKAIVTLSYPIPRRDLEQIIPYASARMLVLNAPPAIVVYECPCRHTRENPCQPTQVCMMIGRSIADFMLKHHPDETRRISQAEALELLRAEHERGHVHSAWFKDAIGGRFYALCNCCRCCCFGLSAMREHKVPIVAASGYVARIDSASCTACAACGDACPFGAIDTDGEVRVRWEACMGCGVCTAQCPEKALSLVRDERKGIPLDVRLFEPSAPTQQSLV